MKGAVFMRAVDANKSSWREREKKADRERRKKLRIKLDSYLSNLHVKTKNKPLSNQRVIPSQRARLGNPRHERAKKCERGGVCSASHQQQQLCNAVCILKRKGGGARVGSWLELARRDCRRAVDGVGGRGVEGGRGGSQGGAIRERMQIKARRVGWRDAGDQVSSPAARSQFRLTFDAVINFFTLRF